MDQQLVQPSRNDVIHRSLKYIREHIGDLNDLPKLLVPVIWVTVYRAMETTMIVELNGGHSALVKSMLLNGGKLSQEFKFATLRIKLLRDMLPVIRRAKPEKARIADAELLTDILKWGIIEAGNMSLKERSEARRNAKSDPEYDRSLPAELQLAR